MNDRWRMPLLCALAMSVGWGYRGDYGHEAGAMIPGALLGLAAAMGSRRPDWIARVPLLGMLGAIGWAFGGQMSYGLLIGYTMGGDLLGVGFGFGSLFLVGALWGGLGAGILSLGLTWPRTRLEDSAVPLTIVYLAWWTSHLSGLSAWFRSRWSFGDTDWYPATIALVGAALCYTVPRWRPAAGLILSLAIGWWLGYVLLAMSAGLQLNPGRSESWAGCVGLMVALLVYLHRTGNRVGLWLAGWGLVAGGIGFAVGEFTQVLSRADWGPIGASPTLRDLNGWKWMEQLFGLIMGLGVGLALQRVSRAPLAPPADDAPPATLSRLAPLFLIVVIPWEALWKTIRTWSSNGVIREGMFGLKAEAWAVIVALAVTAVLLRGLWLASRDRLPLVPASDLGRGHFLFLWTLWLPAVASLLQVLSGLSTREALFVHVSFWLTASACSWILMDLVPSPAISGGFAPSDTAWQPVRPFLTLAILAPIVVVGLAWLSISSHKGPLRGARFRFAQPEVTNSSPRPAPAPGSTARP